MKPPAGKTTYTMLPPSTDTINSPVIVFDELAIKWITAIVDIHNEEVGFYAAVDERIDGSYFIRDVFYPKHSEMCSGTCEISPEGEADLMNWLFNNDREADIERIKFWGHSHHSMGTSPSPQDERQSLERIESTESYLIRAICNKAGDISVSFFDNEKRIRFDNIKWTVETRVDPSKESGVINRIQEIINEECHNSEKIKDIKNLLEIDREMDEIKSKVKKVEKINEPVKPVHNQNYNRNKNTSNFNKDNFYDSDEYWTNFYNRRTRYSTYPSEEKVIKDSINQSPQSDGPFMEESEADEILNYWEQQRYN